MTPSSGQPRMASADDSTMATHREARSNSRSAAGLSSSTPMAPPEQLAIPAARQNGIERLHNVTSAQVTWQPRATSRAALRHDTLGAVPIDRDHDQGEMDRCPPRAAGGNRVPDRAG